MLFTDEHKEIRRTVANFVENEVNPYVDQWEDEGIFPAHDLFRKAGELGLLGISKPVEQGGMGLDYSYNMVALEEWGLTSCGSIPMAVGVQTDMATPALARFGSDQLKEQFLAPAIAGDMVCSIGVSEPSAGSDVAAIKTTARKRGDDYVINGQKVWISRAEHSDLMVLLVRTTAREECAKRTDGMSVLLVDMRSALGNGLSIKPIRTMMNHGATELFFDDLRVPVENLVGEEGKGFRYILDGMNAERILIASECIGDARWFIDHASDYARDREVFG